MSAVEIGAVGSAIACLHRKSTAVQDKMRGVVLRIESRAVIAFRLTIDGVARKDNRRLGVDTISAASRFGPDHDVRDGRFGVLHSSRIHEIIDMYAIGIRIGVGEYLDGAILNRRCAVT